MDKNPTLQVPFEHFLKDFLLSPTMVLNMTIAWFFSGWKDAFPCQRIMALR